MAEYIICQKSELTAIADVIRAKTGSTDTMKIDDMPIEIDEKCEILLDAEEMKF